MTRAKRAPARAEGPATAELRRRLEAVVVKAPELAEMAALYQVLLPPLRSARLAIPLPDLDLEAAHRCLAAGQPVLLGMDLALDVQAAARLFVALCRAAEKIAPPAPRAWPLGKRSTPTPAAAIRKAVESGVLDLDNVWSALASNDAAGLSALAAGAGVEAGWLRLLGRHSLRPAFQAVAASLSGRLDLDSWRRGQCPVCGSPPLLAEVQGKEGARVLRCGLCGSGWGYPRLQCVFCQTTDHRRLGYLCLEGEGEKYRAQTCDDCRGYVKVVVTFDPIATDLLPAEDLATLHLDSVAAERGFARAPVAA